MKLVKSKCNQLTQTKTYDGLLKVDYKYRVSSTEGDIAWNGPLIPPAEWHKMLSFFRWTYETTKSESQARLYVNTVTNTWKAWAYPQEARTGMSAKELDTPDAKTQRAAFPDSDGWTYFGTVHHHCDMGASQSGVDQHNEETQDGLHITIGNIARDKHDMHCRFYLGRDEFSPDMSMFWDIGATARDLLPLDLHDRVARHQMCAKVEVPFPQQWKENLIEVKTIVEPWRKEWKSDGVGGFTGAGGASGAGSSTPSSPNNGAVGSSYRGEYRPLWMRLKSAIEEIERELGIFHVAQDELDAALGELRQNQCLQIIVDAMVEDRVKVDELIEDWERDSTIKVDREAAKAEADWEASKQAQAANNYLLAEGGQKVGGDDTGKQEQSKQTPYYGDYSGGPIMQ